MERAATSGEQWLRAFVVMTGVSGIVFIAVLTWWIGRHASPQGDGMEYAALPVAIGFIFLPLSVPALILGGINKLLPIAAFFAVLSIMAYGWFWVQITTEIAKG